MEDVGKTKKGQIDTKINGGASERGDGGRGGAAAAAEGEASNVGEWSIGGCLLDLICFL